MALQRAVYRPRDAAHTVLHQVIAEHLEAFLRAVVEAGDGAGLPQFVEREFREFLTCGVFEHGVARFRCEGSAREHLVPFSCKGRGWCPSCGGRRMTERAGHLVDAVLPWVPVRQWVLTVPYRLRYQMAWHHGLSRAVPQVYTRVLLDVYTRGARARGMPGGRTGSVTVVQRAGSGLNVNLHFHTSCWTGCSPKSRGGAGVSSGTGADRRRGRGSARDDPLPGATVAGAPRPGAGRRRDGPGGSARGRVPRAGGDRRGLGPGADGAGLARGGAGAAARRCARHGDRDLARAAAGAPGRVRPARQRVGVGERSGGGGASVQIRLASALRAGAPADAGRWPRRAGAQEGVARRDERIGLRAAGVPGTVGGDDAAARSQLAYLPWCVGPARTLARASGRLWTARARAHGRDGAAGRRSGRHGGEDRPSARLGA